MPTWKMLAEQTISGVASGEKSSRTQQTFEVGERDSPPEGSLCSLVQDPHYIDKENDLMGGQGIHGDRVQAHFPNLTPFTRTIKAWYSCIVSSNKNLSISTVYVTHVIYDSVAAALYEPCSVSTIHICLWGENIGPLVFGAKVTVHTMKGVFMHVCELDTECSRLWRVMVMSEF